MGVDRPMEITLNGQTRELTGVLTVTDLLVHLGFGNRPVLVERNRTALFPREFSTTPVNAGDEIEVIELAAGG